MNIADLIAPNKGNPIQPPPQGGGWSGALQTISPLALAMAQGLKSGQGAQAYMGQGLAQMMAQQEKRKEEETSAQLDEMLSGMKLSDTERALIQSMDLGGKQSYLANLMMYNRQQANRGGGGPSQADLHAAAYGELFGPSASTGTLSSAMSQNVAPPGGLSFGSKSPASGAALDFPIGTNVGATSPQMDDAQVLRHGSPGAVPYNMMPPQEPPQGPLAGAMAPPQGMPPASQPAAMAPMPTPAQMPMRITANQPQQAPQGGQTDLSRAQRRWERALQASAQGRIGAPQLKAEEEIWNLAQQQAQQPEDPIAKMRAEIAFAVENGVPREEAVRSALSGQSISVSTGDTGPQVGTIPPGYQLMEDPQTGALSMQPIPGSAAEREAREAARETAQISTKESEKDRQTRLKLGTTMDSIRLNLEEIDNKGLDVTGPIGAARRTWLGQAITGSDAVDFQNRTDQITDSAALSEVQNMRDNSPTGGAVGQLTDDERRAIGNSVTALNTATSAEEYARAARAYQKLALDIAFKGSDWAIDPDTGEVIVTPKQVQEDVPAGLTPEEWAVMPPEDRALWQN